MMWDLLTNNSGIIIPRAKELFSKNGVVRLLLPFTFGDATGKWAIQGWNIPLDGSIEAILWSLRFCDSVKAIVGADKSLWYYVT